MTAALLKIMELNFYKTRKNVIFAFASRTSFKNVN